MYVQGRKLAALLFIGIVASPLAAQEPAAHWCFEEREGETTSDRVAGNDASLVDLNPVTAWVPGEVGIAGIEFDGEGGYLEIGDPAAFDLGMDFTWAAYIRTDHPNAGTIISKSPTEDGWGMGSFALFVREGVLTVDVGYIGDLEGDFVADGEWHFVALAVTHDVGEEGGDLVELFVDGVASASFADWDIDEFGPPGEGEPFKIGFASPDFPEDGTFFEGTIDDVRVWNEALALEAIEIAFEDAGEGCTLNPPNCEDPADTHCDGLAVTGPDGDLPGAYTLTATATDDGGDDIIYHFSVESEAGRVIEVTSLENEIEVRLRAGTWTASVTVDDDPWCDDEAANNSCSEGPFEVLPLPAQLVAHYCMEEREGDVVIDATGGANGLIVQMEDGAVFEHANPDGAWVPGCVGFAGLDTGSVDGFVAIDDPEGRIDLAESFTIATTIRTDDEFAGTIFAQSPSEETEPGSQHFFIAEGLLFYDVGFVGEIVGSVFVADGECHHVAVVVERDFEGDNERVQFYVDGVLDTESTFLDFQAAGEEVVGEKKIGMGAMYFPDQPHYQGVIDNLKIWNYPLALDEIEADVETENEGCEADPPECPAEGDDEDGDSRCIAIETIGPEGALEGTWEFFVEAEDATEDALFYTLELLRRGADGEDDEELSLTQFDNPEFFPRLRPGDWEVSARVDDDLFCEDTSEEAICGDTEFTVNPLPEILAASFCFEDEEPEFTEDVISGIGADLIAFPEGAGDGEPPAREDGLDDGSDSALLFDGLDDAVVVDPHPAFDLRNSYSVSATILVGDDPATGEPDPYGGSIWMLGPELGESADVPGVQDIFVHEGFVRFTVLFVGEMELSAEILPVNDGLPHRVLLTVDADFEDVLDRAVLYIDGQPVGEWEADFLGGGLFFDEDGENETHFRIGYSAPDWPSADFPSGNDRDINHFNGLIDNVKVWSYALSEDDALEDAEDAGANCEAPEVRFKRGDSNADAGFNIADALFTLNHLFSDDGVEPGCLAAADANVDGGVNIADALYTLNHLFGDGPEPPPPFEACGPGTASDLEVGCAVIPPECR